MMGKTHFTVGLATALAVLQPKTLSECLTAVIAGSLGGVTADNDTLLESSALAGQITSLRTVLLVLLLDYLLGSGMCAYIMENEGTAASGLIAFLILWVIGYFSAHRTFTHSFLAMVLYSLSMGLIYPPLALGFMAAYLSHLFLDLLNKKKLPLLYPIKCGVSLNLCYANRAANAFFLYLGYIVSAVLLVRGIIFGLSF
jgi:inner membrane protein